MSRSGYCDDMDDTWAHICWRGAVASAIKGNRGQAFLVELAGLMDAMPDKRLVAGVLEADGQFCTLGVVAAARGVTVNDLEDAEEAAQKLGIATSMAREIVFMNDEASWGVETPERRWARMREWITEQIKPNEQGAQP